ncbi:hypothetical protein D0869_06687 [Hortaea werneckii]|uniref:tRNA wybutosine-synthesizing protein 2 n=1 Tax=Hortaea werneckii TaxID=91943 RepID=A0A3M6YR07_HORWE|nr:hypothetical protein KC334_g11521 [Hortaea werneckii]KAI6975674.1 hypothetical protein KC355_g11402 [Hortaea werneckii]KAI7198024.1 hypothetical protein KC324_g4017 [Hortaea werneckii]KAI7593427.1 hypothetical protein KC316_g1738 [Hortaea werneckii]KAI7666339.1 hypothetical protein KC318_g6591 [Hortaea werneckii]
MQRATAEWLAGSGECPEWTASFIQKVNRSYVCYGSMVLLPSTAFDEIDRKGDSANTSNLKLHDLYKLIAKHLKITHIAVTRPIPLEDEDEGVENIVRAPTNFTPLFGDFGPSTARSPPTESDIEAAYWVTAKQNGINQIWAPRWTMFSRGNISEKARLMTLHSVLSAVEEGEANSTGCTAIDLYAGIGYFTFSYLKAGVTKVLGWDLNPWSTEGLMRGAKANKWPAVKVSSDDRLADVLEKDVRLLVFNEDNCLAEGRIDEARNLLPPIRHVNCGLLPTSRGSWQIAVHALDANLGGWIHVHENFAVEEIPSKAEEVRREIQRLAGQLAGYDFRDGSVKVEYVNKLKSFAPGVMHCVIDIYVPPRSMHV